MWFKTVKGSRKIPKKSSPVSVTNRGRKEGSRFGCEWKWMTLWEISKGRAPGETFTDRRTRNIELQREFWFRRLCKVAWTCSRFPQGPPLIAVHDFTADLQSKAPEPDLAAALPFAWPLAQPVAPIHSFHIQPMRVWRHKCRSFSTTCSSVGPTAEFRIPSSFLPLWICDLPRHPCTRPSNQPLTWPASR